MKRTIVLSVLGVATVLAVVPLANGTRSAAKPTHFSAVLSAGQEVPHPSGTQTGAAGKFTATLYTNGSLKWTLTFAHLTGSATAAHMHRGTKGKAGPVAVALCGPCKSGATGTITGTAAASAVTAMAAGQYYVNVHTAKNPTGEIRGQITAKR